MIIIEQLQKLLFVGYSQSIVKSSSNCEFEQQFYCSDFQ